MSGSINDGRQPRRSPHSQRSGVSGARRAGVRSRGRSKKRGHGRLYAALGVLAAVTVVALLVVAWSRGGRGLEGVDDGGHAKAAGEESASGVEWQTFSHPEGGFRLELPGTAERLPQFEEPGEEAYGVAGERYACRLNYMTLTPEMTAGRDPRQILEVYLKIVLESARAGAPTRKTFIQHAGLTALDAEASHPDGPHFCRAFYHRGRVIGLELACFGNEPPGIRERFFNSFEVQPSVVSRVPRSATSAPPFRGRGEAGRSGP